MPQASEEQRAEWGITDFNAIFYLEAKGYKDAHHCWILPTPDHVPTEKEVSAIHFLMDEWDWSGIVSEPQAEVEQMIRDAQSEETK